MWYQPPPRSSLEISSADALSFEPTGTGAGKPDLVPAVVDAELEAAGDRDQLVTEAVDHRQGQVAVCDRRAEGTLCLRPLDIDVDPLVVAGQLGEAVDHVLGDLAPSVGPTDRPIRPSIDSGPEISSLSMRRTLPAAQPGPLSPYGPPRPRP